MHAIPLRYILLFSAAAGCEKNAHIFINGYMNEDGDQVSSRLHCATDCTTRRLPEATYLHTACVFTDFESDFNLGLSGNYLFKKVKISSSLCSY